MNKLYYGDNLNILRKYIKDDTIDLCYIDPPFNSKRNYNQIYNNIGQEISVETIQNENAEYDVSDLSNGVYFLRMQLNNKVVTKKIIIQH